ncbi:MAG: hypothetical protein V9G13_10025 [Marmoricola sp.]
MHTLATLHLEPWTHVQFAVGLHDGTLVTDQRGVNHRKSLGNS